MKAVYFDGESGENIRIEDIPADMQAEAKEEAGSIVGGNFHVL